MPEVICLSRNPEATISAIASLRRLLNTPRLNIEQPRRRGGRPKRVGMYRSFEEIKIISPASALIIAAEYERIKAIRPTFVPWIANVERWDPGVFQMLREVGFFDLVGFPKRAPSQSYEGNFTLLRMRSGETADTEAVGLMIDDLRSLFPSGSDLEGLVHLYGAMTEAVVNVVTHAYPAGGTFAYPPISRWWMTGAVDRQARWMTAVVYDQGVTIPVTLPGWQRHAGWKTRLKAAIGIDVDAANPKFDGAAIAAAVEESVSSTGEPHRGHGLAQMRMFVDQCREGHLRVMSRSGEVVFRPKGGPEARTFSQSIGGTLIEWNVLL